MFNGRFRADNEDCLSYAKWLPYIVNLYLPLCDSETGDYRHLPFPGSWVEQPAATMEILRVIQLGYRKVIAEEIKRGRK